MADTKISAMTALTAPAGTDQLAIVDDDANATKSITFAAFLAGIEDGTSAITTGYAGTDTVLIIDGGVAKYTTYANLLAGIEDATTAITSGYAGTDTLLLIDGGVAKYTTYANLLAGIEDGLSDIAAIPALTDTLLLIDGGTAKYVSRRSLMGVRYVEVRLVEFETACATGDKQGGWHFHIPPDLNGLDLVYVHAEVDVAGTTNTMDIEIYNVTQTQDMLSTTLTIDTTPDTGSDQAATPYVIHATQKDVATNDLIRVDCDAVHDTPATGLVVTLGFG